MPTFHTLRLILGDQLNYNHSWFRQSETGVCYVLMEIRQETDYTRHHVQKVIAFFAAMRCFAAELRDAGHYVNYITLDQPANTQSLTGNLQQLLAKTGATLFQYLWPDEYRLDEQLRVFSDTCGVPAIAVDSEHFITDRLDLRNHFAGKKMYLMESFYRMIRRKTGYLMEDNEPISGKWNYDHDNRSGFSPTVKQIPPITFRHDHRELLKVIRNSGVETIGEVDAEAFNWPVNRTEALEALTYFCQQLLPEFGTWQDMMSTRNRTLYHSLLSFAMNTKLIRPTEVVEQVIAEWRKRPQEITLAQTEGFVRQIIGWREYMRGIYWDKMPAFATLNYFEHNHPLPKWFWDGNTKMNCQKQAIRQSLETAYAHHIQRLMITGNFALLAGVHPDEIDQWYLGVYIDAIEWVEITNARGMSQFADGGSVGSKPYASSANYIDKMSDYCKTCAYDRKKKHGAFACPFNSLYWHFYTRNRKKLERNPRIGMIYRTWDKMQPAEKEKILNQADTYLSQLDQL